MTKREIEVQILLLRHRANGCLSSASRWRTSQNTETAVSAIAALSDRYIVLNAEADGLQTVVDQWEEFGQHFQGAI